MSSHPAYRTGVWRKLRLLILERDGYLCKVPDQHKCTKIATCVDHVQPISQGGSWYSEDNLRASCTNGNSTRANQGRAIKASRKW